MVRVYSQVTTAVRTVTGVSSFLCAAADELATAAKSRSERAKPVALTTVLTEAVNDYNVPSHAPMDTW